MIHSKPMKPLFVLTLVLCISSTLRGEAPRPNIVLVMADDQGWGQVEYNGHPRLKTPCLNTMADAGIRFDRFYAAGPVCSPTRASVLTGRTHLRTGVPSHGNNLCLQEKTLPQALKTAGYATALFGKWHLNGVRGPGVPILGNDANHPGLYGFDEWLAVSNYFDVNPLMSRNGTFEEYKGDSSDVVVAEALKFMARQKTSPFLAVIWYGSPHSPMLALDKDRGDLPDNKLGNQLGELAALDRSIGTLREGLRELGIEKNTLVWYCSDNGGLDIDPDACGNLRDHKGSLFEGGIRVPGIVEWPGHIQPAITAFPASTMDIMPTIIDLLDLPENSLLDVRDGESILALFSGQTPARKHPIPFYFQLQTALVDGEYKLLTTNKNKNGEWKLYNLQDDPGETRDLSGTFPERFNQMKTDALAMIHSVETSAEGKDYPEGAVIQPNRTEFWTSMKAYQPYFETFFKRPEYNGLQKKVPEDLRSNK